MVSATGVMYFAFIVQSIPIGIIIGSFLKGKLPEETLYVFYTTYELFLFHRNIFYMSMIAIVTNFFLRFCTRFISAMRLQFITILHPVFLQVPLLLLLTYVSCHHFPLCFMAKILQPMGLKWYCARWIDTSKPFSDYFITLLWFTLHLFWNYSFVSSESFLDTEET